MRGPGLGDCLRPDGLFISTSIKRIIPCWKLCALAVLWLISFCRPARLP